MGKVRRVNPNIKAGKGRNERDTYMETDKLHNKSARSSEERSGDVGSIRIIVDGEKPFLEIKSKEGWVRSDNTSVSGFSFKK
tara:strand:- start:3972 stop:4217 length:246 start_codon:yes stop_codon:yes gene_type:complete